MITLKLPPNQNFLDPGVITLTDEGLWVEYDNGESDLLCDQDGYVCDVWNDETDNFIKEVFYKMKELED